MKKGTIPHQIIGTFEDLGKSIVEETAKVPSKLINTALESDSGRNTADKSVTEKQVLYGESRHFDKDSANAKLDASGDQAVRQVIARAALKELTGKPQNKQEPTVYEERIHDENAKKQKQKEEEKALGSMLKPMSTKPKRGDPYAAQAKAKATEAKFRGTE